jgi:hypothetical protein
MYVQGLIMNKSRGLILILLTLIFYTSCMTTDRLVSCYNKALLEFKSEPAYHNLLESFADTLNHWIEKDIKGVRYLQQKYWQIDSAVFFNSDRDKALLFLIAIDQDGSHELASVKIIGGEIIQNQWVFYYQSYPILYQYRKDYSANTEIAFQQLSEYGIRRLSSDGYVKWITRYCCWVDYEYIDSDVWFANWMRDKHQDFLESKW